MKDLSWQTLFINKKVSKISSFLLQKKKKKILQTYSLELNSQFLQRVQSVNVRTLEVNSAAETVFSC